MRDMLRIVVLVSGRGSNLQAILDAIRSGSLQAVVVAVLSDQLQPEAFRRVEGLGIPTVHVNPVDYPDRQSYDSALASQVSTFSPGLVVLAGFMRVLSPAFLNVYPGKVVNIHPALLPSFPGLDAQGQAVDYGVRYSGCTVHFVNEGVDAGPVILQMIVPVHQNDTEETLAGRILVREHFTYPAALQLLAEDRVQVEGRRVQINWQDRKLLEPQDVVLEWQKLVKGCVYVE